MLLHRLLVSDLCGVECCPTDYLMKDVLFVQIIKLPLLEQNLNCFFNVWRAKIFVNFKSSKRNLLPV